MNGSGIDPPLVKLFESAAAQESPLGFVIRIEKRCHYGITPGVRLWLFAGWRRELQDQKKIVRVRN